MMEEPEQPEGEAPEDGTPDDPAAPGPEIEGLDELDQAAAEEQPDSGQDPTPEGSDPSAEGEQPEAEEQPAAEAEEQPAAEERPRARGGKQGGDKEEVIPGAHLEPDLVLEEQRTEGEFGEY